VSLDDGAEFSPTVTVDSVATTVDVASGYSQSNRRLLYVSDTASIAIGRFYRVANAAGQVELVKPVGIASGDYLTLEDDLAYDYAITTSTLKGVRMTFPVDATWVADESNILGASVTADASDAWDGDATRPNPAYKAVWTYTVNSIVRRHYSYLRLVRQPSRHNVTYKDLQRYLPEVLLEEYRDQRGLQCRDMIDAAWGEVRADIIGDGYRPEQIRDTELVNLLVTLRTVLRYASAGLAPDKRDPEQFIAQMSKEYTDRYARTIANLRVDIDQGDEGAATTEPARTLWFRS